MINVSNAGTGTLSGLTLGTIAWGHAQSAGWLAASLSGSTAPATLTLTATPTSGAGRFGAGTYTATVSISSSALGGANATQSINVTMTVAPGAATQLIFAAQPSNAFAGEPIPTTVTIADAFANTVTSATNSVTISLGANPGGSTLSGTTTVSAVAGVATFGDLELANVSPGYSLVATASGLTGAMSQSFAMVTPIRFAAVSAGTFSSCGVATTGIAYCCGQNNFGQLGNGSNANSYVPVAVAGGLVFSSVSVTDRAACGVTTRGSAYCWGLNVTGIIGPDTTTNSNVPVAVALGFQLASISAGYGKVCGVTIVGAGYCWGLNSSGELGNGTTNMSINSAPTAVAGGLVFASISSGNAIACGVTTSHAAYCWGDNTVGQAGNGTTSPVNSSPVSVSGGLAFASISAMNASVCGVTTSGVMYCWGIDGSGQLGNGTTVNTNVPVAVSGGLRFTPLSSGSDLNDSYCGVTPSGAAYCWGQDASGELGNASTASSSTPVAVVGGQIFASISTGSQFACGVTTVGAAFCWGANGFGTLGTGTFVNSSAPIPVVPPSP